jgi:hypothetical protein
VIAVIFHRLAAAHSEFQALMFKAPVKERFAALAQTLPEGVA